MTSTHKPSAPRPQGPVDPRIYRRIFEQDQDGAAILDELWRVFAKSAVCEGGIDAVLKTYRNDGARMVLEHIVRRINQANGVTDHDDGNAVDLD
jgi:hypothetical protein